MNYFPKVCQIELYQQPINRDNTVNITCTSSFDWIGYKIYSWLWWKFKIRFYDFEVWNKRVEFTDIIPKGIPIVTNYYSEN